MFTVTKTIHGTRGIVLENPSAEQRFFLRYVAGVQVMTDKFYGLRTKACVVHQCDSPEFVQVEIWNREHEQEFVDALNTEFEEWVRINRQNIRYMEQKG